MLLLGQTVARYAALVCVKALTLAQELKFGQDLGAILWCLRTIPDLFLVLAIENFKFVLFQSLNSNDLTDRLLFALATLKKTARHERGEEAPILLRLLMPYIKSIDEEHAIFWLLLLIVLDHVPILKV